PCAAPPCPPQPPCVCFLGIRFILNRVVRPPMSTAVSWLMLILLLAWLIWAWHRRLYPLPHTAAVAATVQRLLKPRTPDDCLACRRHTAPPAPSVPPPPPVTPWREIQRPPWAAKAVCHPGLALPQPPVCLLPDYRRAGSCPGRRRRARALRADSDVALPGMWGYLQHPARYPALSA